LIGLIEGDNLVNIKILSAYEFSEFKEKGDALYDLGKYSEALKCYNKALEINPYFSLAWYNKGLTLYELGEYSEAIDCFERSYEYESNYDFYLAMDTKRIAEYMLNNPDAKKIDLKSIVIWYNKGTTLVDLGKYSEALKYLDRVLEIFPNFATAWNNKGVALEELGNLSKAIECYDRVLEINPNDALARNNKRTAQSKLR
jgi:tetratricopeptide (TPR) repeat protein